MPDKRRSFGYEKPSRPPSFQPQQQQQHGHQRSRSSSDLVSNPSNNGRRNNFGLQTLVEEEDANRKKTAANAAAFTNLDSLQDMINTLKNLPPIISNPISQNNTSTVKGHRKQQSMSALLSGNGNHQVTSNKRLSYNNSNGVSDMQSNLSFEQPSDNSKRRSGRSQSISGVKDSNIFNTLSRDEALAEAEAKLMGTFQPSTSTKREGSRRNSDVRPSSSHRYSGSQQYDNHGPISSSVSSGVLTNKRTSLQMPTLNENVATENGMSGRRINFNKPLNLSAAKEDALNESKRLSAGHQRRSSRNLDYDWRASSGGGNSNNLNASFQLVPFTPTRVNFARDDANPHQRRPLFIAHLPFSALPPLFRSRQLSRGTLRVNKRNRSDAYVYCEDLDDDIFICGSRDRNRALEGDVVAVRLVDVDKVLREKKEKEEAKLVRNGGQAKVRLPDEEDENEIIFGGDEDVNVVKPKYCGVVVAILERAQNQVFSG